MSCKKFVTKMYCLCPNGLNQQLQKDYDEQGRRYYYCELDGGFYPNILFQSRESSSGGDLPDTVDIQEILVYDLGHRKIKDLLKK